MKTYLLRDRKAVQPQSQARLRASNPPGQRPPLASTLERERLVRVAAQR